MRFSDALCLPRGVIAIVGSGGKTSLLKRLAAELTGVILTTSTHIYPLAPFAERVCSRVEAALCVGSPAKDGKLTAPQQSFAELARYAPYVLVEADGSKQLPLKAHAPHEPAIPPEAACVITLVGASGLNRPIEEVVHRPQLFFERSGAQSLATPQAVARVLQAEGLAQCVLINQCDSPEACAAARALAAQLPGRCYLASLQGGIIECLS